MRFGLFIPQGWRLDLVDIPTDKHWSVMRDLATYADNSTWDSVWVYDHFHTVPVPTDEATHEAWTLMSAFAATTERVKLGQMCTAMSYRNPAYLAKVAATVDVISGGRTQMGIGGGWYEHEWRALRVRLSSAGERLGRLDEGVQIMRDAWRDGRVTFDGKYYQVDDAIVAPTPPQEGGLPLWIAGGGEKVTLRIAAKYAQYTNFSSAPAEFERKSQILAGHCGEVGTDYGAIVRSANVNSVIAGSESEVKDRLRAIRDRQVPKAGEDAVDAMLANVASPDSATGTPEQVVERLTRLRDLGCEYAILYFPEAAYDRSGIELFEREVIPPSVRDRRYLVVRDLPAIRCAGDQHAQVQADGVPVGEGEIGPRVAEHHTVGGIAALQDPVPHRQPRGLRRVVVPHARRGPRCRAAAPGRWRRW